MKITFTGSAIAGKCGVKLVSHVSVYMPQRYTICYRQLRAKMRYHSADMMFPLFRSESFFTAFAVAVFISRHCLNNLLKGIFLDVKRPGSGEAA